MNVSPALSPSPSPEALLNALSTPDGATAVLVAGAPGMGKSSVLSSVAEKARRSPRSAVTWVDGSVVASEGHLSALLVSAGAIDLEGSALDTVFDWLAAEGPGSPLLVIDNLDALVFKRERVACALATFLTAGSGQRLLASCHPAAADRLTRGNGPFAKIPDRTSTFTLVPLGDDEAKDLVRRRAPRLPPGVTSMVIAAAGGHPAALVFLSRMAEVGLESELEAEAFFDRAAEFAGAVYAESWAQIGPQQRAILFQITRFGGSASMAEIAEALVLPASHVGAQMSRLVTDGLVLRPTPRGRYEIPLLLARWIERRATRGPSGRIG
jgi:ATPase family protein associated with various cellular activities (AAA)